MELTLTRLIGRQAPDGAALITDRNEIYTYSRLLNSVHTLSAVQEPRCVVFCLCSNTVGSLTGYLSCLEAGAVPLLLDWRLDRSLLLQLIDRYRPRALWVPRDCADIGCRCTVAVEQEGYVLLKTEYPLYPIHSELALLLTTSGSTGSPKLVRQSMKNILSNAASIAAYLELAPGERPITTLPMHYTYGLSVLHSHLISGGTLLLTDKSVMDAGFWEFFDAAGATSLAGVPATYDMLRRVGFFEREMPSLHCFTQAGGKLSLAMHETCARFAQDRGLRFYVMYGQTEATARMAYLPWQRSLEKCGSIGIPIPGGIFSLTDENGGEITQPDVTGELVYSGDNVTLGYAQGPEDLARGDERHGVLHTGDLARRDADGFYYIVGRRKRFLKLAGNRVNLDECEQLVKHAFPDADCACCGTDARLKVFVTLAPDEVEAVRDALSDLLRLPLSCLLVRHIDVVPRSNSGKILYPQLETMP